MTYFTFKTILPDGIFATLRPERARSFRRWLESEGVEYLSEYSDVTGIMTFVW